MKRYFSQEEIEEMSPDRKQHILTSQAETFRHAQEQSQKYFRTLLASIALVIGLSWSDIVQTATNLEGLQPLLSSEIVFQNGVAQTAPGIVQHSFQTGTFLATIAFGLLLEGAMTTIWIMKLDGPLPTARRKDVETEGFNGEAGSIEQWIWINDRRVTEALLYLNRCYTSIWAAIIFSTISIFLFAVTVIGFLPMMGFLNIAALLTVPLGILYYLKDPVSKVLRGDSLTLRKRIESAVDRWHDSFEYVGPSAGMKMAIFLIYGEIWHHSIDVVSFWLKF